MRVALYVLSLSLCVGCTPDFDDPRDVKDLRILAMRADPPEQLFDAPPTDFTPVAIEALVVDPRDPGRAVVWEAWACSPEADYCEEAAYQERIAGDTTLLDGVRFKFLPSPAIFEAAMENDPFRAFGGLPIMVELRIFDGLETLRAIKRVAYTFPLIYSPLPPGKVANTNPAPPFDSFGDDTPITVEVGSETVISPSSAPITSCPDHPLSSDCYWVTSAQLPEGGGVPVGVEFLQVPEFYTYRFYTSGGKLSHAETGGAPSPFFDNKKVEDLTVEWRAPEEPGDYSVWVVVDDGRGGMTWSRLDYRVNAAL